MVGMMVRAAAAVASQRTMPELEIRPFSLDDTEAMWRLFRQPGVLATTLTLPSQRLEQRQARYEALSDDDHLLVAVRHGEVAGTAGLHVEKGRRRHVASMGIAVSSTHRRAGVGDALMRAVLDLADNWLGLRRVELGVLTDNEAARQLYEKHGFVVEGVRRRSVAVAGELCDEVLMARVRPAMPEAADEAAAGEAAAGATAADDDARGGDQAGIGASASSP
jgi:putative acetyltransferase